MTDTLPRTCPWDAHQSRCRRWTGSSTRTTPGDGLVAAHRHDCGPACRQVAARGRCCVGPLAVVHHHPEGQCLLLPALGVVGGRSPLAGPYHPDRACGRQRDQAAGAWRWVVAGRPSGARWCGGLGAGIAPIAGTPQQLHHLGFGVRCLAARATAPPPPAYLPRCAVLRHGQAAVLATYVDGTSIDQKHPLVYIYPHHCGLQWWPPR